MRLLTPLLCLALFACADPSPARANTSSGDRVKGAQARLGDDVKAAFEAADAHWPPRGLFLRAIKNEDVVEVWAQPKAGKRRVKVKTLAVCQRSGVLGPKVRSGDLQVPEGFYFIDRFNPRSRFHLSLGLNYPNAVDRARTPKGVSPGGDIFIHGSCVTIGCLPLEDGPIEWLYLAADAARSKGQRRIPVHIFPCRFGTASCQKTLDKAALADPALDAFWTTLRPGFMAFETHGVPPKVAATRRGYVIRD